MTPDTPDLADELAGLLAEHGSAKDGVPTEYFGPRLSWLRCACGWKSSTTEGWRNEDAKHRAEHHRHVAAVIASRVAAVTAERYKARAAADELAASVFLLAHDAHPVYSNTAGWRGGIGGQAITPSCSIVDPPPDALWTQCDMPTEVARDWVRQRDTDWQAIKVRLVERWTAALSEGDPA